MRIYYLSKFFVFTLLTVLHVYNANAMELDELGGLMLRTNVGHTAYNKDLFPETQNKKDGLYEAPSSNLRLPQDWLLKSEGALNQDPTQLESLYTLSYTKWAETKKWKNFRKVLFCSGT